MMRTASEAIRNLEMRVARLERRANKYKSMSLEEMKQTPFPRDREERRLFVKVLERKGRDEVDARFDRQSAFIKSEIESTGWRVGHIGKDSRGYMVIPISAQDIRHKITLKNWVSPDKLLSSFKKILPLMTSQKRKLISTAFKLKIKDHAGNLDTNFIYRELGVENAIPESYPEKAEVRDLIRSFVTIIFYRNEDLQDQAIKTWQEYSWAPGLERLADKLGLPYIDIYGHTLYEARGEGTISRSQYDEAYDLIREISEQKKNMKALYRRRADYLGI